MLLHTNVQSEILENLFPLKSENTIFGKAEEALRSHMIIGFEEALDQGMPPMEALGHVLNWAATEMARINGGGLFDRDGRHPITGL